MNKEAEDFQKYFGEGKIDEVQVKAKVPDVISDDDAKLQKEQYKKYDDKLAKECFYCGFGIVDWISTKFTGDADSWQLD